MTDREQNKNIEKPERDKKLTLDKEQLIDLEPKPEDEEQVRGGSLPGGGVLPKASFRASVG